MVACACIRPKLLEQNVFPWFAENATLLIVELRLSCNNGRFSAAVSELTDFLLHQNYDSDTQYIAWGATYIHSYEVMFDQKNAGKGIFFRQSHGPRGPRFGEKGYIFQQ